MEVVGKIKLVGEVQTFGANGFRKASLILDITENPEYPQFVNVDITQDNTDLLKNYAVGQDVKVSINLGGREWINPQGEAKYFNSVTGWRIEKAEGAPEAFTPPTALEEQEDDLPF